jgi:hypothetical protein
MTLSDIIKYLFTAFFGGLAMKIYDHFFSSKKEEKDTEINLLGELREQIDSAFERISSLQKQITHGETRYLELEKKYVTLKSQFEIYKTAHP